MADSDTKINRSGLGGSDRPHDGDTGEVVEGPVGSASIKQPAEAAASAAHLDALPKIEAYDPAEMSKPD